MGDAPERKYIVGITVGADSWEDILRRLEELLIYMERRGEGIDMVSGGSRSNVIAVQKVNENQTHEKYFEQLNKFLEENRE